MVDINFISSNPAIDEFNRANKLADEQATAGMQRQKLATEIQQGDFNLQQSRAEGPTKLRQLSAGADLATAEAQRAQAQAPYAGPQAAATLEQTQQATKASIASMNNAAAAQHMEAFTKELALLDAGDVEGAKRLAASVGDTIPDAIIQNSQARATIKTITAAAQQYFPSRPKDQMAYITAHLTELGKQQGQGQVPNPQTAPYQPAAGAPTPQEAGATQTGETERIINQLRQENPHLSYADAVGIAKRAPNGDTIAIRKETLALNGAKSDPAFATDPNGTLENWRRKYGLGPMGGAPAAAPGAAPAAPVRPQNVPEGSAYSPSRNQWRDATGKVYNADGSPAQASQAAPAAAPGPQPPLS
jgi:hypothetical protein